jgi:RNA polymerase sigma-70 factor (ECF subfamily)
MSTTQSEAIERSADADADLLARIRAGNRTAESDVVRRYSRAVLAIARQRLRHAEDARDVAQETFIVVLNRLRGDGIDDPGALAAFVRQTAVNLATGERRKQERRRTDADSEFVASVIDESAGPLALLERGHVRELVHRLIRELAVERDRQLLWRHYVLSEDKDSLCREFNLTQEHFDRVVHRARHRLRELAEAAHARP